MTQTPLGKAMTAPASERTVWHTPTEYNAYRDGPPYLPMRPFEPVKLSSEQRAEIRSFAKKASPLIVSEGAGAPMVVLLGMLQAVALLHQTHHWSTRGVAYYADHQLFERLYNESLEFIDQVAERAVGQGTPFISAIEQVRNMQGYLGSFGPQPKDALGMVQLSLNAELACLSMVETTIKDLETTSRLSPGTSNLLEGIADKHETFIYLLRQRAQGDGVYDYAR